ncbi:MAG: cell wall hydrolase [Gammaproteobacteria bacterium]|nr:cell wall hydrolase [Gammaproteobacteria bacterium]
MELLSVPTMIFWLAFTTTLEGADQPVDGQKAIVHIILNRVEARKQSVKEVVLASKQFSCFNDGVPALKFPTDFANVLESVYEALQERLNGVNPYKGCEFYFRNDIPRPSWSRNMEKVASIEDHGFWRE